MINRGVNRRAQVTIFIIVAIVIVAGVIAYFAFRGGVDIEKIPVSIEPVYAALTSCLEDNLRLGLDVLGSQGGYIYLPEFEPGSAYSPFSSQLDFLGNAVPYWYYVSGNNIQKEQVPTIREMEKDLARFVEEKSRECDFDKYNEMGYVINFESGKGEVDLKNDKVELKMKMNFFVEKAEDVARITTHEIVVNSKMGKLYDSAKKIYDKEQEDLFLEKYAVDTLRLYAPVDGVELTCSPLTWVADEVFNNLEIAIEANTIALKAGDDFSLSEEENKYFVVDLDIDENVRFLNSKNWTNNFEVAPVDSNLLISKPIGNQQGMGILGFCYVPYHFVYNLGYPVLIQVYSGDGQGGMGEVFQFPVAVVIKGNRPREALESIASEFDIPPLCDYQDTVVEVNAYDMQLNSVIADISYECLGASCNVGETSLSESLQGNFPQCSNGFVVARAEGYRKSREMFSSINGGYVDILMDKLYEQEIEVFMDGQPYSKEVIISVTSENSADTIMYPNFKKIELSEGSYEFRATVYRNSSLKFAASQTNQCIDVPQTGLGGLFGLTREKCFDVEMPAQIISNVLSGGGTQEYYVLESELINSNKIRLNVQSLKIPKTIDELQNNYLIFEDRGMGVVFK